jgi:hypothetical protein
MEGQSTEFNSSYVERPALDRQELITHKWTEVTGQRLDRSVRQLSVQKALVPGPLLNVKSIWCIRSLCARTSAKGRATAEPHR